MGNLEGEESLEGIIVILVVVVIVVEGIVVALVAAAVLVGAVLIGVVAFVEGVDGPGGIVGGVAVVGGITEGIVDNGMAPCADEAIQSLIYLHKRSGMRYVVSMM